MGENKTLQEIKKGWMSISAASRVLGIPRPTIHYWINSGAIAHRYPPNSNLHQVRLEDLIAKKGGDQG